jgi:hypothetical protein
MESIYLKAIIEGSYLIFSSLLSKREKIPGSRLLETYVKCTSIPELNLVGEENE